MSFPRPIAFGLLLSVLITTGQGCLSGGNQVKGAPVEDIVLDYWRVFDGEDDLEDTIRAYETAYSNVRINYRRLRFEEYEDELIRAFAEGRGPDIFSIHNTWVREYGTLIEPMPSSVQISQIETRGTIRKETVNIAREIATISEKQYKNQYVDVVANDMIIDGDIYGFPLSVDTLGLYYNTELLNNAGIPNPPATWDAFQEQTTLLTSTNLQGEIVQSGAALGTAENVERSTDVLALLMMQTGAPMNDARGNVAFHLYPEGEREGQLPSLNALEFYTDFANPTKEVYSWNNNFAGSFESFSNGETAFFLGYSYHAPLLRAAAPKLSFGITNVPQIADASSVRQVNIANYWTEVVSNQTEHSDWAWHFLQFAASEDIVPSYLSASGKPTALRSLIETQLNDATVGEFTEQVLTAQSWYRGKNVDAAEEALKELIDNYLNSDIEPDNAINLAATKVQQTY
ncbi:MAG: extracellular solute-binding protein [bacterium]|nr:extracellular solute-binding protein [bacterium]MDA1024344.1 extracellular solute-binding protein [bacterium]